MTLEDKLLLLRMRRIVMVAGLSSVQNEQIITSQQKRKFKHHYHMSLLCL